MLFDIIEKQTNSKYYKHSVNYYQNILPIQEATDIINV